MPIFSVVLLKIYLCHALCFGNQSSFFSIILLMELIRIRLFHLNPFNSYFYSQEFKQLISMNRVFGKAIIPCQKVDTAEWMEVGLYIKI